MNVEKMITICDVKESQSGKTLGIKDETGQWFQTKHWDLQQLVGHAIQAQVSSSEFNGKTMYWINDYQALDGHPALPRTTSAPQTSATPRSAQTGGLDRDASIVAQALCKTLEHANAQQAWNSYKQLYAACVAFAAAGGKAPEKAPEPAPVPEPEPPAHVTDVPDFDDDIPF